MYNSPGTAFRPRRTEADASRPLAKTISHLRTLPNINNTSCLNGDSITQQHSPTVLPSIQEVSNRNPMHDMGLRSSPMPLSIHPSLHFRPSTPRGGRLPLKCYLETSLLLYTSKCTFTSTRLPRVPSSSKSLLHQGLGNEIRWMEL